MPCQLVLDRSKVWWSLTSELSVVHAVLNGKWLTLLILAINLCHSCIYADSLQWQRTECGDQWQCSACIDANWQPWSQADMVSAYQACKCWQLTVNHSLPVPVSSGGTLCIHTARFCCMVCSLCTRTHMLLQLHAHTECLTKCHDMTVDHAATPAVPCAVMCCSVSNWTVFCWAYVAVLHY